MSGSRIRYLLNRTHTAIIHLSEVQKIMACNVSDLEQVELFQLLDEYELKALAEVIDSRTAAAGGTIFYAGDPGDVLYVVRSGEVELSVKDTTGQKIVLATAEKNEIFG